MQKLNCWEYNKCQREPGGKKVAEFGVCPVCLEVRADKINDGRNAGRACWAVAGTMCQGVVSGKFSAKVTNCLLCNFYQLVCNEQGKNFQGAAIILDHLKNGS